MVFISKFVFLSDIKTANHIFPALNVFLLSDSPMDMSVIEGEEKPVSVNEVPEYAAEIHTYLREMEVRH